MKSIYQLLFLFLFFATLAVGTAKAQTVTGSIGNGKFAPGQSVRATVVRSLPGGLHANSHNPGGEYSVPTTVRATASGVRIGAVSYPRGHNRKFDFSSDTLNVYEGRTAFSFNINVPSTYKSSTLRVNVTVK